MQRGAITVALLATLGLGGLGACGSKKKSAPSQTPAGQVAATGPTPHKRLKPAGPPPPTAPDPTYEERRRLLLQRGNPEMMKDAPVAQQTAPDVKPADLIKPLGKDLLKVGNIKVDLAKGRAEIEGKVAATTQPLEYAAVAPAGKAYESLLTVETTSIELRLALSLMGYEGTMPQKPDGKVAAATPDDTVFLALIVGGKEKPISTYMIDKKTKKPPKDVPWQVIGFQQEDKDQALLTRDFFTLVARDYFAPVRYSVDPGNSYAGPDVGYVGNAKLLQKDMPVTLVIKRNPAKQAPVMPDMSNPDSPFPITPSPPTGAQPR